MLGRGGCFGITVISLACHIGRDNIDRAVFCRHIQVAASFCRAADDSDIILSLDAKIAARGNPRSNCILRAVIIDLFNVEHDIAPGERCIAASINASALQIQCFSRRKIGVSACIHHRIRIDDCLTANIGRLGCQRDVLCC